MPPLDGTEKIVARLAKHAELNRRTGTAWHWYSLNAGGVEGFGGSNCLRRPPGSRQCCALVFGPRRNVRYGSKTVIRPRSAQCLLLTQNGHWRSAISKA